MQCALTCSVNMFKCSTFSIATYLVGLLLPDLATVPTALDVLGCSPWTILLEIPLSDSLFLEVVLLEGVAHPVCLAAHRD